MKPEQFHVIAELIRSRDPIRSAAKAVLVDNLSTTAAATANNVSPQSVSNALKRFRSAHDKVMSAYLPAGGQ